MTEAAAAPAEKSSPYCDGTWHCDGGGDATLKKFPENKQSSSLFSSRHRVSGPCRGNHARRQRRE
jgi:hypothetical protein